MKRIHYLAAETFSWSYPDYQNHLKMRSPVFSTDLPRIVDLLERGEQEGWDSGRLSIALECGQAKAEEWQARFRRALEVVDAPTPAASLRASFAQTLNPSAGGNPASAERTDDLLAKLCRKAGDFLFRLAAEGLDPGQVAQELGRA